MRVRQLLFSVMLAVAAIPLKAATSFDHYVDLKLVLAVDMSGSMDSREQQVQRDGYVQAFRDPEVLKAILSGPYGRIAVTYIMWAGAFSQQTAVPWTVIASQKDAAAFATALSRIPLRTDRGTSISPALLVAANKFDATPLVSERSTIDISGDGSNNDGVPVAPVRAKVIAQGITINGLPILIDPSGVPGAFGGIGYTGLDDYYHDCVIGGPASFVIPIKTLADFAPAIRRKLILEIAWLPEQAGGVVPVLDSIGPRPTVDCAAADRSTFTYIP
jgi:hypothetical protein